MSGLERLRLASRRTLVSRTGLSIPEIFKSRCHDIDLVQLGISEKVGLAVSFMSTFFVGFILAYVRSWRLALALSSILPCIIIIGSIMNKFVSKYTQ
jgi:ABC-type multidrug transport system fused ATPase/permease subunit